MADLLRLQKYYFDRGYLDVRATLEQVEADESGNTVQLHVRIEEGEVTVVREVEVRVTGAMPPELPAARALARDLPLRVDEPITKAAFDASRDQLLLALAERRVRPGPRFNRTRRSTGKRTRPSSWFTLEAGERTAFGQVTIPGRHQGQSASDPPAADVPAGGGLQPGRRGG